MGARGRRGAVEEIEFENVMVVAVTDAAFLLSYEGDEEWWPKSQIDWTEPAERGDEITMYAPEWLCEKKGWV